MYFAKQTIAWVALVSTLSSGLALTVSPTPAEAQVVRQGRSTVTTPTVVPQRPLRLTAPLVISGTWQGNMHSAGDDALTHLTLQINGSNSNYQGTWQIDGQDGILDSGNLTATKQGSTMTINLNGLGSNQGIVLTGTVNANGTAISGQVVDSSFVFSFTKS
ncbi:MAG: hypothetical protein HY785_24820 [Oscillatoriophycideae cyanobacterium NC_groundwater_1537_Pr4_S-0.65um_50_18]|jgi:hypothetical protein|nr:hypothetical protein [Oscillatoriophycideae cyanobacterium NC_groundwater_1537_Pr4_S-0.65um_50_18]